MDGLHWNEEEVTRIRAALDDPATLLPVVVQDLRSRDVLMLAYINREALDATLATGRATFFSRSRQELWIKGESSGHRQWVSSISFDCDHDALLFIVEQEGVACHTGERTCFHHHLDDVANRP